MSATVSTTPAVSAEDRRALGSGLLAALVTTRTRQDSTGAWVPQAHKTRRVRVVMARTVESVTPGRLPSSFGTALVLPISGRKLKGVLPPSPSALPLGVAALPRSIKYGPHTCWVSPRGTQVLLYYRRRGRTQCVPVVLEGPTAT